MLKLHPQTLHQLCHWVLRKETGSVKIHDQRADAWGSPGWFYLGPSWGVRQECGILSPLLLIWERKVLRCNKVTQICSLPGWWMAWAILCAGGPFLPWTVMLVRWDSLCGWKLFCECKAIGTGTRIFQVDGRMQTTGGERGNADEGPWKLLQTAMQKQTTACTASAVCDAEAAAWQERSGEVARIIREMSTGAKLECDRVFSYDADLYKQFKTFLSSIFLLVLLWWVLSVLI